jgi:hypothetical protein
MSKLILEPIRSITPLVTSFSSGILISWNFKDELPAFTAKINFDIRHCPPSFVSYVKINFGGKCW